MQVSIIIVNWNSQQYLRECLSSLSECPPTVEHEIIVIDSASFDGADQMLRDHYPYVRFVQSASNVGFATANNRAFRESSGEYVLFLNPDTVLAGSAIDGLHRYAKSIPQAGVLGCRLMNPDGTVQSSCIQAVPTILNQLLDSEFLRAKWPKSRLWGVTALHETRSRPHDVEGISGACLLVKRSTFAQVGGFNEEYFMYMEDLDLCHKIRQAGYKNYYVPEVEVIHHGGGSSQQAANVFSAVMMREATWRFLRTTRGELYGLGYRMGMFASAIGRLALLGSSLLYKPTLQHNASKRASFLKWFAVLRWSVKRDDVVKRYYRTGAEHPRTI